MGHLLLLFVLFLVVGDLEGFVVFDVQFGKFFVVVVLAFLGFYCSEW